MPRSATACHEPSEHDAGEDQSGRQRCQCNCQPEYEVEMSEDADHSDANGDRTAGDTS
jgi:hypothetical protein